MHPLADSKQESLPQWLPQVRERLVRLCVYNLNALQALEALDRCVSNVKEGAPMPEGVEAELVLSRDLDMGNVLDNHAEVSGAWRYDFSEA